MRIKLILKVVVTFFCFSCVSVTSFSKTPYEACIPSDWDGYLSFNVKACLLKQLDSLALETASKYPRMKSTDIDRQVERCVSKEPSLDGELKWLSDFDCKVDAYEQVSSSLKGNAHATSEFDLLVDQPIPAVFQKGPFKDLSVDMKVWCVKSKESDGLRLAELKFSESINGPTIFEINRSRKGFDYSRWSWVENDYFASGKYATFSHYKGVYRRRNNPIARELVTSMAETGVAIWLAAREDSVVRGTLRVINKNEIADCLLDDSEWGTYQDAGDSAKSDQILKNIAGVYKIKHRVELMDKPNSYDDKEDILEIVPISGVATYVKIRTYFTNAHKCAYQGVFEYKASNEFIAVSKPYSRDNICVLKMTVDAKKIRFFDESPVPYTCQSYCGSRGQLTATDFSNKSKRRIRYLPRLKNSDEYLEAVRDYKVRFKRD